MRHHATNRPSIPTTTIHPAGDGPPAIAARAVGGATARPTRSRVSTVVAVLIAALLTALLPAGTASGSTAGADTSAHAAPDPAPRGAPEEASVSITAASIEVTTDAGFLSDGIAVGSPGSVSDAAGVQTTAIDASLETESGTTTTTSATLRTTGSLRVDGTAVTGQLGAFAGMNVFVTGDLPYTVTGTVTVRAAGDSTGEIFIGPDDLRITDTTPGAAAGRAVNLSGVLSDGFATIGVSGGQLSPFDQEDDPVDIELSWDLTFTLGEPGCDIEGDSGDNELTGTAESEIICGFGGNDVIDGGGGDDIIMGGPGEDTLDGGSGDDTLLGGADGDIIIDDAGINTALGGSGADSIAVTGTASGCAGADRLQGSPTSDTLRDRPALSDTDIVTLLGGPVREIDVDCDDPGRPADDGDTIIGAAGNDTIEGGPGDDLLFGGTGDDTIGGGGGSDIVLGGTGVDIIDGDGGGDILTGCADGDILRGGKGGDTIRVLAHVIPDDEIAELVSIEPTEADCTNPFDGDNTVFGGGAGDTVFGGPSSDTIDGGGGDDTLEGLGAGDDLTGGPGRDTLRGGRGGDTFHALDGERDRVAGGPGVDRAETDARDRRTSIEGPLRAR